MVKCEIVNVVATASLCQKLELNKLKKLGDFSYNPSVYGGNVAYFKTKNMIGRVSVFASGKMISVGTKSQQYAFRELQETSQFLVDNGFVKPVAIYPKTRNMVVTVSLDKNLNLEELAENSKVIYEPEQFPALILCLETPHKASILIFSTGKVVITGLTSSTQIKPIVHQVRKFIGHA